MAHQSVHDVVKQPQSVDALRSTDVFGTNKTELAARAATDADTATFNGRDIEQVNLPLQSDNGDASHQNQVPATYVETTMPNGPTTAKVSPLSDILGRRY